MSSDSIVNLLLGIPIAIITGLYSGIIVSRYVRFAELRNEALRIIRSIDFIQENEVVNITNDQELNKLTLIASDLLFLNHKKAAENVLMLNSDIQDISIHARNGRLDSLAYEQNFKLWQEAARNIPASKLVLWSFFTKL